MSMSKTKCCVPGCADSGGSHNVLHGFPHPTKDTERFNSWVFFIGGDILALDNHYIYSHRRVCHAHFEEKYCCRFDRISNIAVPTLNMPGPLLVPDLHEEEQRLRVIQEATPSTSKDKGILPKECKETADVLLFFDNLFDSQNGSFCKRKVKYAKPLLGPVTPTSAHHAEWLEAKKMLNSMVFITKSGKKENVPTLKNWVWTLDGVEVLLKNLETQHHVTSVYMRHLNQDPIENFFGTIRSHGCRNTNPTPEKFESAFTTFVINNLSSVHSPYGTNCEADKCETLHALIITDNSDKSSGSADYFLANIDEAANADNPRVTCVLNYISGYLIKKTKSQIFKSCATCKKDLVSVDSHEYIRYREFGGRQWLHSPTPAVVAFVRDVHNISHAILTEFKKYYKE